MGEIGAFAYGAVIGWLGVLFVPSRPPVRARSLALALTLFGACGCVTWGSGGVLGLRWWMVGLAAGGAAAFLMRSHEPR